MHELTPVKLSFMFSNNKIVTRFSGIWVKKRFNLTFYQIINHCLDIMESNLGTEKNYFEYKKIYAREINSNSSRTVHN